MVFKKRHNEKTPIKIKGVVHPLRDETSYGFYREKSILIKPGIIEQDITAVLKQGKWMGTHNFEVSFTYEGQLCTSTNCEYDKSYKKLQTPGRTYDVDFFVDVTPEEIEWMDKNRKYN